MNGIITHARITEMPKQLGDEMPTVKVRVDNGDDADVFTYYPDEISFVPGDFIGLTVEEAKKLHLAKDILYLQSS